jgi:serine/threonine-protein kinase HipA
MTLPERIKFLDVSVGATPSGRLLRDAQFVYTYSRDDAGQAAAGLLMPPSQIEYRDTGLFPVMDQNLPEGFLYERLREVFPKQPLTPMHLLALIGSNGIGRLGFSLPDAPARKPAPIISRQEILRSHSEDALFEDLVHSYLSTGIGVAGIQPKILVPDRATFPVPNLIVKAGSEAYPGLAANEYLCLRAAQLSQIVVPEFELSENGKLLVLSRFDLKEDGARVGFEDVAALMGKQVRDVMENRKYHGSYEGVAEALRLVNVPKKDLAEYFSQVAFSVMVGNGDAHLKNFGVLYESESDVRLSPMFDVVSTSIYVKRQLAGESIADTTMALKLFKGQKGTQKRDYPTRDELLKFGSSVCGVRRPAEVMARIASGMRRALEDAKADTRIPRDLLGKMSRVWHDGMRYDCGPDLQASA